MNYNYTVIKERLEDDVIGDYITYGITVSKQNSEILTVSDVSVDYDTVFKITSLCNEFELEPVHLIDVIEDMICNDV